MPHSKGSHGNTNKSKDYDKMTDAEREAIISNHKKNLDALTEANKTALEVMKNITKLQAEYMRQTFEDFAGIMKHVMKSGPQANPHDVWSHNSDKIKAQVCRAAEHNKSMAEAIANTQTKIYEIFHDRVTDASKEIAERHKKKTTH